jgi:ComF family protein
MSRRIAGATWLDAALSLLFPPQCPGCGAEVSGRSAWCTRCLNELWKPRLLDTAEQGMPHVKECRALTGYDGAVRKLLHGLKFERRRGDAAPLAWLVSMADAAELAGLFQAGDVAIPVPLSALRREERGYNQVELIFADWCREQGMQWENNALLRRRHTAPQWELDRKQRQENINGAFVCNAPELIRHSAVILLDDIVTTGATLEQCALALHQAGAASVRAFCLAHD